MSLPVAKLLKEKGLKLNFCREIFYENPHVEGEYVKTDMVHDWELIEGRDWYSAPTIAEVVCWIYDNHKIWIEISLLDNSRGYYFDYTIVTSKDRDFNDEDCFDSAKRIYDKDYIHNLLTYDDLDEDVKIQRVIEYIKSLKEKGI